MKKLIRITTDNEVSVHDFPTADDYYYYSYELRKMVGEDCDLLERVKPKRLYNELNALPTASMLIDEEGLLKDLPVNLIASYLYESDLHGSPIVGNVLIVSEEHDIYGELDFCGFTTEEINFLYPKFKKMEEIARKTK